MGSPWPKFRHNAFQNGRSKVKPTARAGAPWELRTAKGVFSSPVVGADGTVFIGSADRTFYAVDKTGSPKWKLATGEIIDSSALLDDKGRVYVGSGDGHLYALDAATGQKVWDFAADDPSVNHAFINWFEGNVAIGPDGRLWVPNDNFFLYAVDRDTGAALFKRKMPDQTWSLPAIDPSDGSLVVGNNNLLPALGANTFAFDAKGEPLWNAKSKGSVAASPLLTGDGKVVVGGFDGYVRAYDQKTGELLWSTGTRDHIYASPAQAADGTLVQPSCDGTIYALDPATGAVKWAFDTLEAVRSSPAIDGDGNIYVGTGEGKLVVLKPDGTLRWAMRLIDEERNDLNASPALGEDGVFIAGESGQVFGVPYDYCLGAQGKADARCSGAQGEDLPADGAHVLFTTQLGAPLATPPDTIDANQVLAFSLFVRQQGDTRLALLDAPSLSVTFDPPSQARADISGDRRFLTVVPGSGFAADAAGRLSIRVQGQYLVDPARDGLKMTGGQPGGSFDRTFTFALRAKPAQSFAMQVPAAPGDPAGVLEIYGPAQE